MTMLLSRLASLIFPEAAMMTAFVFVLAVVTEPLWQPVLLLVAGGGP